MYCRADLSRTLQLVVALFLTSAATGVSAREFRAADTQNEDYPTVQALGYMGSLVAERSGGRHHQIKVFHSHQLGEDWPSFVTTDHYKFAGYYTLTEHTMSPEVLVDIDRGPFEAAMTGIYARVQRDPAMAQLIERIRKVE